MLNKAKILFFKNGQTINCYSSNGLKNFIVTFINKTTKKKFDSVIIVFGTDEELKRINKDFLQHNYYTDIITFEYPVAENDLLTAEIYISIDRIRDNAKINSVSIKNELHRVIFHGILHLCGYNDKLEADKKLMTQMENQLLNEYFN